MPGKSQHGQKQYSWNKECWYALEKHGAFTVTVRARLTVVNTNTGNINVYRLLVVTVQVTRYIFSNDIDSNGSCFTNVIASFSPFDLPPSRQFQTWSSLDISLNNSIADGPHSILFMLVVTITRDLPISPRFTPYTFLSRCKLNTLPTRQPMVEFYLLKYSRFPLRTPE